MGEAVRVGTSYGFFFENRLFPLVSGPCLLGLLVCGVVFGFFVLGFSSDMMVAPVGVSGGEFVLPSAFRLGVSGGTSVFP